MSSICKICKKDYKYKSKLNKHRNGLYGCKYEDDDIINISNITIDTQVNNTFCCNKCNKIFTLKSSLTRHINNAKCSVNHLTTNNINTTNNNTTNNNSGTINDNRQITNITNNNIIIQHINPFGHENTDFLTTKEKLEILRSGHKACIKILKIVYNRNENKNFYKVNKKSSTISYLKDNTSTESSSSTSASASSSASSASSSTPSTNNDDTSLIDVFQLKEFRKEIFNNSTTLLYGIMLDCKNDFCFEEQLALMDNITTIKNDVYNEIFNNSLSNLRREIGECILDTETKDEINWGIENVISYETDNNNDNNRKKINSYVKQIKAEPIVKEIFKTNISKEKKKRTKIQKELNDNVLNTDEVNRKYGKIEYGELANQLQLAHYPDTRFAKRLTEREKTEDILVRNNNTLGKLNAYNNMKRDREHNINNILKFENNIERLKELSNNDDIVLDNYTTL
jgi:hypothetical protein